MKYRVETLYGEIIREGKYNFPCNLPKNTEVLYRILKKIVSDLQTGTTEEAREYTYYIFSNKQIGLTPSGLTLVSNGNCWADFRSGKLVGGQLFCNKKKFTKKNHYPSKLEGYKNNNDGQSWSS